MEATTLQQPQMPDGVSPTPSPQPAGTPVFVAEDRRRHYAVRLAIAGFGLCLMAWLAALVAGLAGFSPLPELGLPGGESHPAAHNAPAITPPVAGHAAPRGLAGTARAGNRASGGEPGSVARTAGANPGGSAGSTADAARAGSGSTSGGGSTQAAPTSSGSGTSVGTGTTHTNSGNSPSFTPKESGTRNATPPRGSSSSAPGQATAQTPQGMATGDPNIG